MARFRKIDPRIWNDEKFRQLSDRGKLVFLFILTHPHLTALGAMRANLDGLAGELGWDRKAFREAFREGCLKGMVELDEKASFVGARRFLTYNRPESPNVVRSWPLAFDLLPECGLKTALFQRVKAFTDTLGKAFREAFTEAFGEASRKTMPNQEQEQEQEQEHNTIPPGSLRSPPPTGGDQPTDPPDEPKLFALTPSAPARRPSASRPRASRRVPETFDLTDARLAFAQSEGLDAEQAEREFAKFRDHEFRDPKSDWDATWRRWVRNATDRAQPASRPGTAPGQFLSAAERTAEANRVAIRRRFSLRDELASHPITGDVPGAPARITEKP